MSSKRRLSFFNNLKKMLFANLILSPRALMFLSFFISAHIRVHVCKSIHEYSPSRARALLLYRRTLDYKIRPPLFFALYLLPHYTFDARANAMPAGAIA